MHNNGSWDGPVRGTSAWWRGLAAPQEENQEDTKPAQKDANVRWDLVERIKKEIADGTYDTPEKWEKALDSLLDRLS